MRLYSDDLIFAVCLLALIGLAIHAMLHDGRDECVRANDVDACEWVPGYWRPTPPEDAR